MPRLDFAPPFNLAGEKRKEQQTKKQTGVPYGK
jgi:hypothetical protein